MRGRLRLLFAVLRFAPEMGRADLRRLFALLPFATIPFIFIYKEDSFSDVIRRKAAQKAALLFFYSRPPQAGTFSYKSPAAGRLLSAPQAPYQSAARAPLFLPCLFPFLSKGTVAFDLHAAFFTVPFPLFPKRHGSFSQSANFFTVPFPLFAKRHGSVHPSCRFFIPCLFLFLPKGTVVSANPPIFLPCLSLFFPKGTVAFDLHAALFTVPFPLFPKRHGSV